MICFVVVLHVNVAKGLWVFLMKKRYGPITMSMFQRGCVHMRHG